jgi:hypothetical protein
LFGVPKAFSLREKKTKVLKVVEGDKTKIMAAEKEIDLVS